MALFDIALAGLDIDSFPQGYPWLRPRVLISPVDARYGSSYVWFVFTRNIVHQEIAPRLVD